MSSIFEDVTTMAVDGNFTGILEEKLPGISEYLVNITDSFTKMAAFITGEMAEDAPNNFAIMADLMGQITELTSRITGGFGDMGGAAAFVFDVINNAVMAPMKNLERILSTINGIISLASGEGFTRLGEINAPGTGQTFGEMFQGAGNLFSFASGTPYVPRDMMVKVHEGESIIPKNKNENRSTGRGGGGRTINLTQNFNNTGDQAVGYAMANRLLRTS
jgi:hypothetical protein